MIYIPENFKATTASGAIEFFLTRESAVVFAGLGGKIEFQDSYVIFDSIDELKGLENVNRIEINSLVIDHLKKKKEIPHRLQKLANEKGRDYVDEILARPLESLDLSVRAYTILKGCKINFVEDLLKIDSKDFLELRRAGRKTLAEIEEFLRRIGLEMGMLKYI